MTDSNVPVPPGTTTLFRLLPVGQSFQIKGRKTVLVKTSTGYARKQIESALGSLPVAIFAGCKVVAR